MVVGGDHSVAFSSLLAALSRLKNPQNLGYIQFDSHGDLHLFSTSPSGNFHGMWLRPFFGNFDSPSIAKLASSLLRPEQVLFIGNLELEPEELRFFAKNKIAQVSTSSLADNKRGSLEKIEKFVGRFKHLHISFDIDVFHQDYVSATGTPAENGFQPSSIFEILEIFAGSKMSIDLVEVNPRKPTAHSTIKMAQKVLSQLCS